MITGVQDIYYNVTDMEKSVQFYQEVLNMEVVHTDEHWTTLKCGGVSIGLHGTEGEELFYVPRDSHGAHAGGTLTLKSNNISEDKTALENAGAKILGEADAPWGHMLIFEDPDGNVLKLMNPKY